MEKFINSGVCAVRISDTGEAGHKVAGGTGEPLPPGPVVVLLHGYLESLDVWDSFIPLLKDKVRVVAVDLPGHGISEVKGEVHSMELLADTVRGVMDSLDIGKILLVGHSMGGYAALEFLRKYPDRLHGIVLFHSTPDADTPAKKEQRSKEIEIVQGGKKDLLAQTVEKSFATDNRSAFADVIEDMCEQVILTEEEGITALLRGMMERRDMNDVLRGSDVPQMFIFGRKDEYIPVETAESIAAAHPRAAVRWLADSGHMGFIEEPAASASAILAFAGYALTFR